MSVCVCVSIRDERCEGLLMTVEKRHPGSSKVNAKLSLYFCPLLSRSLPPMERETRGRCQRNLNELHTYHVISREFSNENNEKRLCRHLTN